MEINEIKLDKYFYLIEFECPCCAVVRLHPLLLKYLIKLRRTLNEEIYINSGFRCKENNDKVGGTPKSYHRYGMAADIFVKSISMSELASHADIIGFTGIGVYGTFLHLDVRPHKHHWEG